jgi:hypothetical protein
MAMSLDWLIRKVIFADIPPPGHVKFFGVTFWYDCVEDMMWFWTHGTNNWSETYWHTTWTESKEGEIGWKFRKRIAQIREIAGLPKIATLPDV